MFWISLGSTSSKLPDKPSIKTRGEFPALEKVPVPLIFTEAPAPGLPEFCNTLKPGASPANACAVLVTGLLANSLADTEETEPVRFTFFCVPYPTTTTSSSSSVFYFNKIWRGFPDVAFTSCDV